ncbi:MAG TPA: sigma-54 dependent transcriptional regulator [Chloroflexota bacterium]|nr:sigma-54 dependent transcriptional regulator [Chloroflexota bacterium]
MSKKQILIADDDPSIRMLLRSFLEGEGYDTAEAKSGGEVLRILPQVNPDLVLLDLRMPEWDGIEVMKKLGEQNIKVPILLMTAHGTSNSAIQAIQLGAFDYITKPFELDDVLLTVRRFFEYQELTAEVKKLRGQIEKPDPTEKIIGRTPAMQEVYKTIGRVARSDSTVLIWGATGTGKELVAQTLHQHSTYRNGPFVPVSCAALPETLLESELFGHEKGSFTGAMVQRKGRFEMAHKGTIFLDEIGEMSLGTQKKLLRVLQEREFERVGGSISIQVDVRVIAATNKDLAVESAANRFREDLYYRLNVISMYMPPLRERKDDIPALVEHFLNKHRFSVSSPPARISEEALRSLDRHDWPGNVRELENTIERAVVMAQGGIITSQHLYLTPAKQKRLVDLDQKLQDNQSHEEIMQEVEKQLLQQALVKVDGNRAEAAKVLKLAPALFEERLKALNLEE